MFPYSLEVGLTFDFPVMEVTTRLAQALSSAATTRSTSKPFLWVPTTQSVVLHKVAASTELPQEPKPEIRQSKVDWLWINLGLFSMLFTLGLLNIPGQVFCLN